MASLRRGSSSPRGRASLGEEGDDRGRPPDRPAARRELAGHVVEGAPRPERLPAEAPRPGAERPHVREARDEPAPRDAPGLGEDGAPRVRRQVMQEAEAEDSLEARARERELRRVRSHEPRLRGARALAPELEHGEREVDGDGSAGQCRERPARSAREVEPPLPAARGDERPRQGELAPPGEPPPPRARPPLLVGGGLRRVAVEVGPPRPDLLGGRHAPDDNREIG